MPSTIGRLRGPSASPHPRPVEAWEEWEDDDVVTPIENDEQVLITQYHPSSTAPSQHLRVSKSLSKTSRHSSVKIKRLKSKQRQKAQNAKAGIRLITDIASYKRSNHNGSSSKMPGQQAGKFSDAAALKALEGEPNSASVGNWNWLKKSPNTASPSPMSITDSPEEFTPGDCTIEIGISLPISKAQALNISPQSSTVHELETPVAAYDRRPELFQQPTQHQTQNQKSVWSPDTPDTSYSFNSVRAASSVYSQVTVPGIPSLQNAPPVPALPKNYQNSMPQPRTLSMQLRERSAQEESTTPVTLFEEDISPLRSAGGKSSALTPDSAGSRAYGWWDHVVSPFTDRRMSFTSRKTRFESPAIIQEEDPWASTPKMLPSPSNAFPAIKVLKPSNEAPIVRVPTPRRTPPPRSNTVVSDESSSAGPPTLGVAETVAFEKPRIVVTDSPSVAPSEFPPPYSPPKKGEKAPVRYRAVFPPGHPLQNQFPPTPRPASPGLAGTMTSQGSPRAAQLPITPPPRVFTPSIRSGNLPPRALGTYVPEDHVHSARARGLKVERKRRRHEKEDIYARRAGGFWRGRGCMSSTGCFGRTGREGRKRRRVWFGVCSGIIALLVLIIVLAVVLSRPHHTHEVPSIWVNLTDYPPMPTGVLTVVGPDNTIARSGCTEPSTLWSCALPKDEQDPNSEYKPNQPTVIMQVQWDNRTQKAWKVPNGDPPAEISRRGTGAASIASSIIKSRDQDSGFSPNPKAPDFKDMWFLGETTDNVQSDQKAGEPTPFYISLLSSTSNPVEPPKLESRAGTAGEIGNINLTDLLPSPDLDKDGTPAPAVMLPKPVQQPVRLFDRGLPTEHYGFYTHFRRTIYLKSVTVLNDTKDGNIPLDEDGGCRRSEADYLTTWGETRMLVRIWTRKLDSNTTSLLRSDGNTAELHRPGTMPYPVTVTLDTHGGDPTKKLVWDWPIDDRQQVKVKDAELLANNMGIGGTWINPRGRGDEKFGGFDGGTGGCKCEWVNWV